jgi:hypothetical protein
MRKSPLPSAGALAGSASKPHHLLCCRGPRALFGVAPWACRAGPRRAFAAPWQGVPGAAPWAASEPARLACSAAQRRLLPSFPYTCPVPGPVSLRPASLGPGYFLAAARLWQPPGPPSAADRGPKARGVGELRWPSRTTACGTSGNREMRPRAPAPPPGRLRLASPPGLGSPKLSPAHRRSGFPRPPALTTVLACQLRARRARGHRGPAPGPHSPRLSPVPRYWVSHRQLGSPRG